MSITTNINATINATINAEALWGADIVARAAELDTIPVSRKFALRIADNARDLDRPSFIRWAASLSPRQFCAVVQLCSGRTRRTLEAA